MITVYSCGVKQWRFQSCQVTQAGDTRGARAKLMGGEKSSPSPNRRALDCSVVLASDRLPHRPARQYSGKFDQNFTRAMPGLARVWNLLWCQFNFRRSSQAWKSIRHTHALLWLSLLSFIFSFSFFCFHLWCNCGVICQ